MAAAQYFDQVQKIFIAFYQRPADPAGLKYWADRMDAAGGDIGQVIDAFASSAEATSLYGPINATTIGSVVDSLYMALFNVAPDAAGKQFYVDGFADGTFTAGTIALAVLNGAQNNDLIAVNNKVQVANEFTQQVDGRAFADPYFGTGNSFNATYSGDADADAARDILKAVNSQPSTILSSAAVISALKAQIADLNDPILAVVTGQTKLTVGADTIDGVAGNTTYTAPIVQNQNGAITNTLESGDVISAVGTGNKLVADLTLTTSGGIPVGPAISAATNNIQVVELRAQSVSLDLGATPHGNFSHIDAENFNGVQQWWSVNSRSDIQVEDVRSRPEETTIGMRDTDPEVGFRVYFDPQQLSNLIRTEDSALNIKLADNDNLTSLANVPVNGLIFKLDGVQFTLKSDAIGNSVTYADLLAALQAEIAKETGLAGVTATLNPDNTITIQDPAGKSFTPVGWSFVNDQVPANGNIIYNQTVGNPALVDEPITTNVLLDNVGRTSAGGDLDIGSLGDGGVQQFDVTVDRSSWVNSMESTSHLGNDIGGGVQFQHLEIVNFVSTGAKGDVAVGARDANRLDNRVQNGLTDVRTVNGTAFAGKMNLGIVITGDSIERYLDGATAPVNFTYSGSAKDDTFNIDVDSGVSNDPDFRMDVKMAAGNDRLILTGADNLNNISVDGGTGNNTFVTDADIGVGVNALDIANHEFASFENFQNLEIEGSGSTVDFTTLGGVTSVVVATDSFANTTLIDLAVDNGIILSGKNQTIGNNSNADQLFGTIDVLGADGETLTVTLQNTARIDGNLYVDELYVEDENLGNQSAVRTLNIVSAGARKTTNEVDHIHAERVGNFNFSGTQDLSVNIRDAANASGPAAGVIALKVDGSALTGKLTVRVNDDVINAVDANKTASFKGTAGTKDTLVFDGGVNTTAKTSVSGFETVSFAGTGQFNAVNTTGVTLYKSAGDALKVTNMQGVENVELGRYNAVTDTGSNPGGAQDFRTNAASNDSTLNLTAKFAAAATQDINTKGFTTLNLKLDTLLTQSNGKDFDLNLEKVAVDGADAASLVTNGVYANPALVPVTDFTKSNLTNVVVTGGSSTATNVQDSLELNDLSATVKLLDVSGYKGVVTANIGDALATTIGATNFTTGNTVVKVGAFGIDISDASHAVGAETVTSFVFTTDAANNAAGDPDFQWQISDFAGINEVGSSVSNLTVLDLSGLGITGFADILVADVGGNVVITANGTDNFEIVLVGEVAADLGIENFKFAV